MPPYMPSPHTTETDETSRPNEYGPRFFSYQSNAATRCFVPASAAVSPPGSHAVLTFVPAAVMPRSRFVYEPTAHASMYDGDSAAISVGAIAVTPDGTP